MYNVQEQSRAPSVLSVHLSDEEMVEVDGVEEDIVEEEVEEHMNEEEVHCFFFIALHHFVLKCILKNEIIKSS